jgi:hypothetical protein
MKTVLFLLVLMTCWTPALTQAQDAAFPLPAPLYLLTSQHQVLHVDPQTGEQTVITPEGQRVLDFDIAPDGEWIVYRTTDSMVIVSEMATGSGYVLEFDAAGPSTSGPAQTLAWSPDVTAIAYIVADGVRIAELGAGDYGAPVLSTIQGPWIEFYWADAGTIIASDLAGHTTRITGTRDHWTVEAVSGVDVRAQPPILSYLSAEGVWLDNQTLIPRTAGALAYAWGPPLPPVVDGLVMFDNVYYLAADAQGIAQVWQLPQTGDAPHPLTAESVDVTDYAISPDQREIAYIVADRLIITDLQGADRRSVATLQPGNNPPSLDWDHTGTRLAFHDGRGVWTVPADGSLPQRVLVTNQRPANSADTTNTTTYIDPRWSPNDMRLLVMTVYWENVGLSVIDVATGTITPLSGGVGFQSRWTGDNRVLTWNAQWGFTAPGLFLIDPAQPDADPVLVFASGITVTQRARGDWLVLLGSTGQVGPQYLHLVGAAALDGPFQPVAGNTAGGFAANPQISAPEDSGAILVAGLRGLTYTAQGQARGNLVIINMSTGESVQIQTNGSVWNVTWGQRKIQDVEPDSGD